MSVKINIGILGALSQDINENHFYYQKKSQTFQHVTIVLMNNMLKRENAKLSMWLL